MKKRNLRGLLALVLVLCLTLSLAACSAGTNALTEDGKPASSPGGAAPAATGAPGAGTSKAEDAGRTDAKADYAGGEAPIIAGEPEYYGEVPADYGSLHEEGGPAADGFTPSAGFDGEGRADSGEVGEIDDPIEPEPTADPKADDPLAPADSDENLNENWGEALRLTAAEWNDNRNWPFFTNLVNGGLIAFPAYGLNPIHRVTVTVTDETGAPLPNETVTLVDEAGDQVLWQARTDKTGTAYLFSGDALTAARVVSGEASAPLYAADPDSDPQGQAIMRPLEAVTLVKAAQAPAQTALQVMFIVDTTGSMWDELAYLQKDFSAIAQRVGSENVSFTVSFYRDEEDDYVTRHNDFTSNVATIQSKINAEYAAGGGDFPEAVARVLRECLTDRTDWEETAAKVAFLIFDAPPHEGTEAELTAAVRAAAEKGIHLVPVVASNADRSTELFGRALAIMTNGTYVFLTDDSGVSVGEHLEPIVGDYNVELLQDLIVRIIEGYRP